MRFAAVSFFAVAALALVGCGSTPETTRTELPAVGNVGNVGKATPDGAPRHSIACSGANWADCYEKAAAACPNTGYVVVGHESSNASAGGTGSRNMLIECKEYSPR